MSGVRINAEHRKGLCGMTVPQLSKYGAVLTCAPVASRAGLVLDLELALFGHALKGLTWILDAVLIIFAVGWQQPHNLVTATGARPTDRARGVKYGLTDIEFVRAQGMAKRGHLRDCDHRSLGSCDFSRRRRL